eukprot:13742293-Ditylum_brightwellii.AAC.1
MSDDQSCSCSGSPCDGGTNLRSPSQSGRKRSRSPDRTKDTTSDKDQNNMNDKNDNVDDTLPKDDDTKDKDNNSMTKDNCGALLSSGQACNKAATAFNCAPSMHAI